jgi:cupin 2 domain-containing protein
VRVESGNLFAAIAQRAAEEEFTTLLANDSVRIERIVSHGHVTPDGTWYDQEWAEWVLVVQGAAELLFEHEGAPRVLRAGDYVHIPPHARHRVTATDPDRPTVWLALHFREPP